MPTQRSTPISNRCSTSSAPRVVALGESMHRRNEFYHLRHRVFRFLQGRAGFTALVLESGFVEELSVDAWLGHGGGSILHVLDEGVTYYFGKCQEMLDQVSWMREHAVGNSARLRCVGQR